MKTIERIRQITGEEPIMYKILDNTIGQGFETASKRNDPLMNGEEAMKQQAMSHDLFMEAKKFQIDVRLAQGMYDQTNSETASTIHMLPPFKNFEPPFEKSFFIFENPIEIMWSDPEYSIRETKSQDLVAFGIEQLGNDQYELPEKILSLGGAKKIKMFRIFLHFLENMEKIKGEDAYVISNQFITISTITLDAKGKKDTPYEGTEVVTLSTHLEHLCSNKKSCAINAHGQLRQANGSVCQEIENRKAIVNMMSHILTSLTDQEVIEKHTSDKVIKRNSQQSVGSKSIPSPYYNYVVPEKRYKYSLDEISYGSGSSHRFQYDVRRHPRIVNGHLIWVGEHKRGKGDYIPKLYTNYRSMIVPYLWSKAEELTKKPFFERMFIKIITLWRRWKK